MVDAGAAAQAVPVLRKSVDRVTRALMYLDDSSGVIGGDLAVLTALYARACVQAPPKPTALAGWIVGAVADGPGWPDIKLAAFADPLGERGLAEVARLTEERAAAVDPDSWTAVWAVRHLREQLAETSGDIDRYVGVLAEHLDSPVQYERITTVLYGAGRRAEAIEWAGRGVGTQPSPPYTDRLRDRLVTILLDGAGTDPDSDTHRALAVRRDAFDRAPTAATYRGWAATAAAAGADDPLPYALERLRAQLAERPARVSALIDVLLGVGADDEAWRVATKDPQYRAYLGTDRWLVLLERRRASHPGQVIGPYQDLIEERILNGTDKRRYQRAVALLPNLRAALDATGGHASAGPAASETADGDTADSRDAFADYLSDLRSRHARRPAFLKILDTWQASGRRHC
jgi:hypothetical protein